MSWISDRSDLRLNKEAWWKRARFVLLAGLILGACGFYMFQTFTTTSYETVVFNQVTGPTISPVASSANPGTTCSAANTSCAIQNYGSGAHMLTYCIVSGTVTAGQFSIELEGSNDTSSTPGNWMQISTRDTSLSGTSGCGALEAAGYFQWVRANLITFAGTNPKLTAWYSGMGNAIPGGGITVGLKASQPITFVPGSTFTNSALKSTAATISASAIGIDSINVGNPNASAVFVTVTGTSPSTSEVYQVAANGSRDIAVTRGISVAANGTVNCATAVNGTGDPATGCTVVIHFRPQISINSQVAFNGAVSGTNNQFGP